MIKYINFSLDNVFLENGYREFDSAEGLVREYDDEDGLEQALRCLVVTRKKNLSGWDLRFLRRGLGFSQAEMGDFIERDAQTIARFEKSGDPIPRLVDLAIRVCFCETFIPLFSAKDVALVVRGKGPSSDRYFLSFQRDGWCVVDRPRRSLTSRALSFNEDVEIRVAPSFHVTPELRRKVMGTSTFDIPQETTLDPILSRYSEYARSVNARVHPLIQSSSQMNIEAMLPKASNMLEGRKPWLS